MSVLLELTLPFARNGGRVLALKKGAALTQELQDAELVLSILGGEMDSPFGYEIDGELRQVLVVRKAKDTPASYPRRPGMPAKSPLGG
jgi:16S rRNA (guanine527-N7)-methyltransferase